MMRKKKYDPVEIAFDAPKNKERLLSEYRKALVGAKATGVGFIVVRFRRTITPEIECKLWHEMVGILSEMGVIGAAK